MREDEAKKIEQDMAMEREIEVQLEKAEKEVRRRLEMEQAQEAENDSVSILAFFCSLFNRIKAMLVFKILKWGYMCIFTKNVVKRSADG